MADYYEVLQVQPTADPEVIRSSFRALARTFHPDFGGDQRVMMAINEAWSVLGDRRRRAAYDASRTNARIARGEVTASGRYAWTTRQDTGLPGAGLDNRSASPGPLAPTAERRFGARGAQATGSVLDFGRYAGWSVGAVAQQDPDYLLWLERTPVGRPYGAEIRAALERRSGGSGTATVTATQPRRLFGRSGRR